MTLDLAGLLLLWCTLSAVEVRLQAAMSNSLFMLAAPRVRR